MISLLDVAERTQKGPKLDDMAWNMGMYHKMVELTRRYDIRYPADGSFFNQDNALVDRAFQAAIDFMVEQGVYCVTTSRVIQLTREEVLQALRESPAEVRVGEGRDVRVLKQRRIEEREALNFVPAHHAPFSEELAQLSVLNFARLPSADFVEGFNFRQVDGREIFGMPLEAYAARRQLAWMREGVRKAGRPGMAIAFYPINTRAAVLIAPVDETSGLRRGDGILLTTLPDCKVEQDMIAAAIVYDDYGSFRKGAAHAAAGGFCGGVEGAIIEALVRGFSGWICYHDTMMITGVEWAEPLGSRPIHVRPELSWASSVVAQVLNTHFHTVLFGGGYTNSGPGTETCLLELANLAVRYPLNGCNVAYPRHSRAQVDAAQTPMEAEWRWEMAQAVMRNGLTRAGGDELSRKLATLIEGRTPEPAVPARECYDWVNHRPSPAYREIYLRVKEKVAACGLQFA